MEPNKNKKICEVCKDEATCICYKCFLYFCDSCYKIAHNRQKDKEHKKEKIDFFVPIDTKCPEHSKVINNLFCLDDKGKYNLIKYK